MHIHIHEHPHSHQRCLAARQDHVHVMEVSPDPCETPATSEQLPESESFRSRRVHGAHTHGSQKDICTHDAHTATRRSAELDNSMSESADESNVVQALTEVSDTLTSSVRPISRVRSRAEVKQGIEQALQSNSSDEVSINAAVLQPGSVNTQADSGHGVDALPGMLAT
jgi:hypothetical protein